MRLFLAALYYTPPRSTALHDPRRTPLCIARDSLARPAACDWQVSLPEPGSGNIHYFEEKIHYFVETPRSRFASNNKHRLIRDLSSRVETAF
jgi:hypothetical protein